ncbi:MAG: aminotransferase class V-fold PLP-dependent enzyme [Lachnospiraceae bacterium]|nr:aminotransferase class V-fold PLP-dependent enzyme [Lachnospiraceae bacterium]
MTNKISTPIADFVKDYAGRGGVRLHMPGHKGKGSFGFEKFDITEINGADALYEAEGIIAESEKNASMLFGTAKTVYSTEGSSQCIRAMMYLIALNSKKGRRPVVLAARNVHKTFVFAAALLDMDVRWLWPEENNSICSCPLSAEMIKEALDECDADAFYITSPDYLGEMADIRAIADVCHKKGAVLAVDNAHGAYLHFLKDSLHPMDMGADICCDSAHKTLPVITGGAYLHISKNAPAMFSEQAKYAMALFGSTSPSYLCIASLDMCNAYLAEGYREKLTKTVLRTEKAKKELCINGYETVASDPLKITIKVPLALTGAYMADRLREKGIECEYADPDYIVLMVTPENDEEDFERLAAALGKADAPGRKAEVSITKAERVLSIREAVMSPSETVRTDEAEGRICRVPTVSCPPAIPVVVPGERISREAVEVLRYYDIKEVDVIK